MKKVPSWWDWLRRGNGRRYPLVGMLLAAVGGITLGGLLPHLWLLWGLAGGLSLIAVCFVSRLPSSALGVAVALTFAALQAGGQEFAAGRQLARLLGPLPSVWIVEGRIGAGASSDRLVLEVEAVRACHLVDETPVPLSEAALGPLLPLRGVVSLRWLGTPPEYGDRVRVLGRLQEIPPPLNPGTMNFQRWQRLRGIWLELLPTRESDQEVLAAAEGGSLLRLAAHTRAWMKSVLAVGISDQVEAVALLQAMTLGDTSGLTPKQLENFRHTGTLHLFSVSGLHVGMLGVLLWMGFRLLPLPRPWAIVAIILLLFFYSAVTGLRPASLRAATMAAVVLAGMLLDRPARPLNSLAAAGLGILLFEPGQLFNPGFQLSFCVVVAILVLGLPVGKTFREACGPDPFLPRALYSPGDRLHALLTQEVGGLAAVSLSAWLGSLPLILVYYQIISLSAIPANLLAVPLAFVILATAILSLLGGAIWLGLAGIFNHANLLFITLLSSFVSQAADWPGSYTRVRLPRPFPPPAELIIFSAGSGAAQAWYAGRFRALIDTGSERFWQMSLRPWLDREGVGRVSALVLTHGDAQHLGGALAALQRVQPGWVGVGPLRNRSRTLQTLSQYMAEHDLPRRILRAGDRLYFGPQTELQVLYPPTGLQLDLADDKALVLRIRSSGWTFLLLGDAGWRTEQWLLENAAEYLPADVLILGRHRHGIPTGLAFIGQVAPRAIVTSSNDFPAREALPADWREAVQKAGVPLFALGETGAVTLSVWPQKLSLRTFCHPGDETRWERAPSPTASGEKFPAEQ